MSLPYSLKFIATILSGVISLAKLKPSSETKSGGTYIFCPSELHLQYCSQFLLGYFFHQYLISCFVEISAGHIVHTSLPFLDARSSAVIAKRRVISFPLVMSLQVSIFQIVFLCPTNLITEPGPLW